MINQQQLNELYAKKLMETGSHDQAILKVCWVAYQQGLTDANKVISQEEDYQQVKHMNIYI